MKKNLAPFYKSSIFRRTSSSATFAFKEFFIAEPVVMCNGFTGFTANTRFFQTFFDMVFTA